MSVRLRHFALVALLAFVSAGSLIVPAAADNHAGADRTDPVALGEAGTAGNYEITVTEVTPDATDQMMATIEEMMGEAKPPAEGMVYTLVTLQVRNTADSADAMPMPPSMGLVGDRGLGYMIGWDTCTLLEYTPVMLADLPPGEEASINLCWQVYADDTDGLQMYTIMNEQSGMAFMDDDDAEEELWTWFSLGSDTPDGSVDTPVLEGSVDDDSSSDDQIAVGDIGDLGDYEVKVVSVNTNATEEVLAGDEMMEAPMDGQQYLKVTVQVAYTGEGAAGVDDLWLDPIVDFQTMYDSGACTFMMAAAPVYTKVFPGGMYETEICAIVDSANAESLMLMVSPRDKPDMMPLFFSLQP